MKPMLKGVFVGKDTEQIVMGSKQGRCFTFPGVLYTSTETARSRYRLVLLHVFQLSGEWALRLTLASIDTLPTEQYQADGVS